MKTKQVAVERDVEIDPTLPHLNIRKLLATATPGRRFDRAFAKHVGVPDGPAYSTDLNAIVDVLNNRLGWWWSLSHIRATATPTTPAPGLKGLVSNSAGYDREGRPITFDCGFVEGKPALALCEAVLKAIYDLPAAYYVNASHTQEVLSKETPSRVYMMAYYRQRERHRQEAIRRWDKEHTTKRTGRK